MKKKENVKINLTLTRDFYQLLKKNASDDYMKVATWTKRFLMKSLIDGHNKESKRITKNETEL